ncbi:MAG: NADH-quinone oxidoreductase subunit J [Deltaproteobacteria bacterium]|nr:NADH-quinone oxidoreductase subunit J [Deltaproteobacteria bacterium]
MEQLFFYIFALVAIVSAVLVVSVRNAVHSAFYLIICLLQVAAIFILLRSPFLAAVQVFIYVGAVMVLFLFAVMVLDIGREKTKDYIHSQWLPAVGVIIALLLVLGYLVKGGKLSAELGIYNEAVLAKNTEVIGKALFTQYIFPFEVVSLLLLVALVGAIVLVMKDKTRPRKNNGVGS